MLIYRKQHREWISPGGCCVLGAVPSLKIWPWTRSQLCWGSLIQSGNSKILYLHPKICGKQQQYICILLWVPNLHIEKPVCLEDDVENLEICHFFCFRHLISNECQEMVVLGHGSAQTRSHLALGPFCVAAGGPEPTDDPKGTDRHHPSAMVTDGNENSKKCCNLRLGFVGSVKLNCFHQVSVYIAEVLLCSGLLLQTEAVSSRPYSCCICHNAEKKDFIPIPFIF